MKHVNQDNLVIIAAVAAITLILLFMSGSKSRKNALQTAAWKGDGRKVAQLLKKGMDINKPNGMGGTALVYAAQSGHKAVVDYLLSKGANPNAIEGEAKLNKAGMTALMYAAGGGHLEVVKSLLAKGADTKIKTTLGLTAIMMAAQKGHAEMVQALIDGGADIHEKDNVGRKAWNFAQESRDAETMALLKKLTLGKRMVYDQ